MNKIYVLNNSHDSTLFYKDSTLDTRLVSESKRFINRGSAEKFLNSQKLSENYSVKVIFQKSINESLDGDTMTKEIQSSIDDTKDMVDTTIELINACYDENDHSLNEDCLNNSNIEDVLDKLRKIKKYMSGIAFTPYFDNSLGSTDKEVITPDADVPAESDGDSNE
jgi:hypothetical protein